MERVARFLGGSAGNKTEAINETFHSQFDQISISVAGGKTRLGHVCGGGNGTGWNQSWHVFLRRKIWHYLFLAIGTDIHGPLCGFYHIKRIGNVGL